MFFSFTFVLFKIDECAFGLKSDELTEYGSRFISFISFWVHTHVPRMRWKIKLSEKLNSFEDSIKKSCIQYQKAFKCQRVFKYIYIKKKNQRFSSLWHCQNF